MTIGNIGSIESGSTTELVGGNKITISGVKNLEVDMIWKVLNKEELPTEQIKTIESSVEMINSGLSNQSENIIQTGWDMLIDFGAVTMAKIITAYMVGK